MAERGHGRVLNVTGVDLGDELIAAVTGADTVLPVGDVADFDEDGGWLNVNGTVVEYVTVDDDASTITLATSLGVAADEYDRVDVWSDGVGGAAVREYSADIVLDDQEGGDSVAATLDHSLIDKLGEGVRSGTGESVEWERDGSELHVVGVLGKIPATQSGFFWVPSAQGILNQDVTIPTGFDWTTVKDFGAFDLVGMSYNFLDGRWTFDDPGVYLCVFGATFAPNANNARGVRGRVHFNDGTSEETRAVRLPALAAQMSLEVTIMRRFYSGQSISFEVQQTSGADLNIIGNGFAGARTTDIAITRFAP